MNEYHRRKPVDVKELHTRLVLGLTLVMSTRPITRLLAGNTVFSAVFLAKLVIAATPNRSWPLRAITFSKLDN